MQNENKRPSEKAAAKPSRSSAGGQGKPSHGYDVEALMLLGVLAVALFSVLLVTVLLTGVFSQREGREEDTEPGGETEDAFVNPQPEGPLFSFSDAILLPTGKGSSVGDAIVASSAVLVDAESGTVLASKDANQKIHPASMTKVMTLMVLCERLKESDLDVKVKMTEQLYSYVREGDYAGASQYGFDIGDEARVEDLLYGIGVESDADCTMMAVSYLCDSEEAFVAWMNEVVQRMGLKNTHFDNVIGYESEENYSTASDIAAIMMRALQCPLIETVLSAQMHGFTAYGLNSAGEYTSFRATFYSSLFNANPAVASRIRAYENEFRTSFALANGAVLSGGKTGTLDSAGSASGYSFSLVSFARKNGKTYIQVTCNVARAYNLMADVKDVYDSYLP